MDQIKINEKFRDELPKLLAGLQYIYLNVDLRGRIMEILHEKIMADKKPTGRKGMSLWEIFVMAQIRLCIDADYDKLHYLVNTDKIVRQIMGVWSDYTSVQITYEYQNIYDNVTLLDDETLKQINNLVVEAGHGVIKKKKRKHCV